MSSSIADDEFIRQFIRRRLIRKRLTAQVSAAVGVGSTPASDIPFTTGFEMWWNSFRFEELDPLGGSVGYSRIIEQSDANYVANNLTEFRTALDSVAEGEIIFIPSGVTIDATNDRFGIDSNVTIASDRGLVTGGNVSQGALIQMPVTRTNSASNITHTITQFEDIGGGKTRVHFTPTGGSYFDSNIFVWISGSGSYDSSSFYQTTNHTGSTIDITTPFIDDPGQGFISRSSDETFQMKGDSSRITGLRLEGPVYTRAISGTPPNWNKAIGINGSFNEVDNCEIYGFNKWGIETVSNDRGTNIHHNVFHHIQRNGFGYPVWFGGNARQGGLPSLSQMPRFEYNITYAARHDVAAAGTTSSGYYGRYNQVIEHDWDDQHFDRHSQGGFTEIKWNIDEGTGNLFHDGWNIIPTVKTDVSNNYLAYTNEADAFPADILANRDASEKVIIQDNSYNSEWNVNQPTITSITADVSEGASPLAVTFTCNGATDPNGIELDAYYWFEEDSLDVTVTTTNTYTKTFTGNDIYVVGVRARNKIGVMSKPQFIRIDVHGTQSDIKDFMLEWYDFTDTVVSAQIVGAHRGWILPENPNNPGSATTRTGVTGDTVLAYTNDYIHRDDVNNSNTANKYFAMYNDNFSINFWLYMDNITTAHEVCRFGRIGGTSLDAFGWGIEYVTSNNRLKFSASDTTTRITAEFDGSSIPATTWTMCTIVVNFSAGTVKLYKNGSLQKTVNDMVTFPVYTTSYEMVIPDDDFEGSIQGFGLWCRELTGAEITTLYNSGSGVLYSDL